MSLTRRTLLQLGAAFLGSQIAPAASQPSAADAELHRKLMQYYMRARRDLIYHSGDNELKSKLFIYPPCLSEVSQENFIKNVLQNHEAPQKITLHAEFYARDTHSISLDVFEEYNFTGEETLSQLRTIVNDMFEKLAWKALPLVKEIPEAMQELRSDWTPQRCVFS